MVDGKMIVTGGVESASTANVTDDYQDTFSIVIPALDTVIYTVPSRTKTSSSIGYNALFEIGRAHV